MEIQRVVAALSVLLAAVAPAVDAADCPDGGAEFGFRLPRLLVFPGEPAGFASVGFGDLDADGVPEAVAAFLGDPATVRTYRVGANLALEELSRVEIPEAGDVLVADVTGDGVADTIVQGCSENDCAWIRLSVLERDGSGGMRFLASVRSYGGASVARRLTSGQVVVEDLDGDGWDELLVVAGRSPPGIEFVRGGPDRVLEVLATAPVPEPAGGWGKVSVAVRDLDGDGFGDIACLAGASLYWLRGTGPFTFEPPISIASGLAGDDISFHDLDRDGDDDLLIEGFAVLESLGGASFAAPRQHPVAGWGDDTAFGDFDGDGLLDAAVIVGTGDAAVLFFHGTADGRFEAAEGLLAPEASGTAVAGNFHGTERLDIAVAGRSDQRYSATRVYEMLSNGSLAPGPVLDDPISTLKGARALAAADLDGDGVADLLEAHEEGHVTVRLGGPDGPGGAILVTHGPSTPARVVAANVVGSGAQDLITVGRNGAFHGAGWRHDACFRRGDSDADGRLTIGDPIRVLGWLFLGDTSLPCQDAADVDDDGILRIGDAIVALGWLFLGAEAPPPPFEACGTDPSPDELGCESFVPCA